MKRAFTLVEVLVATAIGLVVTLGALTFQHHAAVTADSSARKIEAARSTEFAETRIRRLVENARRVWLATPASALVRDVTSTDSKTPLTILYADGHEIWFDQASRALVVDGAREPDCRLDEVLFKLEGDVFDMVLTADEAATPWPGRPPAFRERSTISSRVYLRPQADARRYVGIPELPHGWCLGGECINCGIVR